MVKLNVFLPWNLPEYFASNGFHDLYDFLIEKNERCDFKTLVTKNFYNKKYLRYIIAFNKLDPEFKSYDKSAAISYLLSNIGSTGCDLDLLHTSPIFASRTKPFVFHLEDFQSIFLHRDILTVFNKNVDLQKIFERKNCLAIISHIPETLQSFRNYFNSPIINEKLQFSKIALSDAFTASVRKLKVSQKQSPETVFLFTSSGHQHPNNYVTRGFKVSINVAKKLIESGRNVKFIFKCVRLPKPDLLHLGLSEEQIDFIYNCPSIVWYEEYLSDDEMSVLYKISDFFLLPSAQLHSMSILKSMYCEAIPVVTDTVGTDQYVTHLKDGIVLKGVKEAVFQDKISLLKANIENYLALESSLTEQLFSNLVKIMDENGAVEKMKSAARNTVIYKYAFNDTADQILSHISREYAKKYSEKKKNKVHRILKSVIKRYILTSNLSRYKQIICRKIFEWEKMHVFKHHSYYHILKPKHSGFIDITKYSKPYKNIFDINREMRRRLFKR